MLLQPSQGEVQDITPDIVEEYIKVIHGIDKFFVECGALVVERLVNAKLLFKPSAFFVRSSNGDHLRALSLSDLASDGTDSPSCA